MLELLDQLKKLPKEVLMLIIFDLMKDEVITYHEVTEVLQDGIGSMLIISIIAT